MYVAQTWTVRSSLQRKLAASKEVTLETVLNYLALVEEWVNNLLLIRQNVVAIDPDAPYIMKPILMGGNLQLSGATIPTIIPPTLRPDFDERELL